VTDNNLLIILASIIDSGLGNLIDRSFNNFRVVDFINFGIGNSRTEILNVGDMFVTFGVLFLAFYLWQKKGVEN
jgi:lipoprotein signal peptidase